MGNYPKRHQRPFQDIVFNARHDAWGRQYNLARKDIRKPPESTTTLMSQEHRGQMDDMLDVNGLGIRLIFDTPDPYYQITMKMTNKLKPTIRTRDHYKRTHGGAFDPFDHNVIFGHIEAMTLTATTLFVSVITGLLRRRA